MSDLFWLTDAQMASLAPFFPKSHGKPRVDDRRVLSGIIFINRNGLRWRDAPREYGPHKTWCDCGGRSPWANEVRYVGLMDISREENDLWNTMSVWMCR
ncbi:transposase [Donghicola eburneus]|uniref:Transposase n=1 Tax=Donghicola eburneus TaxID=393278 RepID=A0A1M4MVV1_9RHOB|nr:transposase [Donghicola eburneus]